jgi:hypothetical protein
MKIGTKSLLFGTHQFLWHPWTVAKAWKLLYNRWPNFDEAVCIFFHDWGYWGCPNMDGFEGKRHPMRGALIAEWIVKRRHRWLRRTARTYAHFKGCCAFTLTALHSTSFAKIHNSDTSILFLPDKASILCEPKWFYLLRARLSGELDEYGANSPHAGRPASVWYEWYRGRVLDKVCKFFSSKIR